MRVACLWCGLFWMIRSRRDGNRTERLKSSAGSSLITRFDPAISQAFLRFSSWSRPGTESHGDVWRRSREPLAAILQSRPRDKAAPLQTVDGYTRRRSPVNPFPLFGSLAPPNWPTDPGRPRCFPEARPLEAIPLMPRSPRFSQPKSEQSSGRGTAVPAP